MSVEPPIGQPMTNPLQNHTNNKEKSPKKMRRKVNWKHFLINQTHTHKAQNKLQIYTIIYALVGEYKKKSINYCSKRKINQYFSNAFFSFFLITMRAEGTEDLYGLGWELSRCMWGWVVCAYDFNAMCRVGELLVSTFKEWRFVKV